MLEATSCTPSGRFFSQFLLKLPSLMTHRPADCYPAKSGPCIILASGPSADHHIEDLRANRLPLFCVDGSMKFCAEHGVRADFVVNCDPHDTVMGFYRELPNRPKLIHDACGLAAFAESFPLADRLWCSLVGTPIPGILHKAFGTPVCSVNSFGSVSDYALTVAALMGFGPILLVGVDFSFVGGAVHSSMFPDKPGGMVQAWLSQPNRKPVGTSIQWLACCKFLEWTAATCGRKVYVAGDEGIVDLERMGIGEFGSWFGTVGEGLPAFDSSMPPFPGGLERVVVEICRPEMVNYVTMHDSDNGPLMAKVAEELTQYAEHLKGNA